jgi:uncharacterized protein (TIGR03067 family)
MHRRIIACVGLALAMVALVRADGGDDPAEYTRIGGDDRAELERGEWRIVGITARGKELDKDLLEQRDMRMVFKGNTLTHKGVLTKDGGKGSDRNSSFKLSPNTHPKEIDWSLNAKTVNLGIYDLEGDTLKIAFGRGQRPKDYSPESAATIYVLKRVRP